MIGRTTRRLMSSRVYGIGTDITKISRFEELLRKRERRFIERALHSKEIEEYENIESEEKRILFVASRWAVKESVYKAMQMDKLQFQQEIRMGFELVIQLYLIKKIMVKQLQGFL